MTSPSVTASGSARRSRLVTSKSGRPWMRRVLAILSADCPTASTPSSAPSSKGSAFPVDNGSGLP